MRFCMVTTFYPPYHFGGDATYVRSLSRELVKRGGRPEVRSGFSTDNGNPVLDVHNLDILEPAALERDLNCIPGIVTVGLFAIRPADVLLLGGADGVKVIE